MSLISSNSTSASSFSQVSSTSETSLSESAVPPTSDSSTSSVSVSNTASPTSISATSRPSASLSSTSSSSMSMSSTSPSSSASSSPSDSSVSSSPSPTSSSSSTPPPTTSPSSTSPQSTTPTSSSSSSSVSTPPPPPPSSTSSSSISTSLPSSSSTSSSESQASPSTSTSSPSASPSSTSSDSSSLSPSHSSSSATSIPPTASPSSSVTFVSVTSTIVTTVNGQVSTVTSTFSSPSTVSLNTPPSGSSSSSGHAGVIIGSAIGGTLGALLLITGIFFLYRRGSRQKTAFSALPTAPRSPPLHEQDFDLEGHSRQPSLPTLLPPRGSETGSIFREEVWPPPNTGSRLQDPLLAASNVDLTSIVDAVMGPQHLRWSSADTSASSEPLLSHDTPEGHSLRPSTSGSNQMGFGPSGPMNTMDPSTGGNQQPVMNADSAQQPSMSAQPSTGHMTTPGEANLSPERPFSLSNPAGSQNNSFSLPPGAAPPFTPFLSRPVNRQRRHDSIQSSGSPPPTEQRAERTYGPLMVINDTSNNQDMPLVDLSPTRGESIPKDNPPLYHTLSDLMTEPLQPTKRGEGPSSQ